MEAIPQTAESIYQLPQRGEIVRMVVLGDEGGIVLSFNHS